MAYKLEVDVIDRDGTIKVTHTFWGQTEEEVRENLREHQADCAYFGAAVRDDRIIEDLEEIDDDELPEADGDDEDDEGGER